MAVFFFVVGLEVKREVVLGELRELRAAVLPFFMAAGGMVVPAGIYLALQGGTPAASGWGTPMATDIAFVVGCLALLGSRVPKGLRVLLLSLAVLDDLGAILVIAIGYTENLRLGALLAAICGLGLVVLARALGVRSLLAYVLLGAGTWLAMHESGVHATLAGVALGLVTPSHAYARSGAFNRTGRRLGRLLAGAGSTRLDADEVRQLRWIARESVSPLEFLEKTLHPWVAFVVMPVFALANAGVPLDLAALRDPVAAAIALGLFVGKPLGIVGFAWLAIRLGTARLPDGINFRVLLGGGCLAGIGFTMALFLCSLSLPEAFQDAGKLGVLVGSLASAVCGMGLLLARRRQPAA
ncbi:MAG: Na(+)/H(+) antiporter NhaA, partial [Planctomycetota bacterium]